MNPGAGMTPVVVRYISYLRPDSCLPVLCIPPSLCPYGFLFQPFSVDLFHYFLCRLAFCSSKKSAHDLSDHGLNMKNLNPNSQKKESE